MPLVKAYIQGRRRAATKGEPCVTPFGRERHFVITNEKMYHIQNEYINTPIQSLASDFTLLSLLEMYDLLSEKYGDKAKIISTVHDSIILQVVDNDPELMKHVATDCKYILENTPAKYMENCNVPFVADAEVGYKWGELKALDFNTGLERIE